MGTISFVDRLRRLADADPGRVAITCGDSSVTRSELMRLGENLAVHLASNGVGHGDMVTIATPNSIDWFIAYVAAWRLGAIPQPISWRLPQREFEAIMELADPPAVVGVPEGSVPGRCCVPMGATSRWTSIRSRAQSRCSVPLV